MLVLAIECGLKIEEFWRLSWREFLLYRKGYEARNLVQWEHTRMIGYMMYSNIMKYEKHKKSMTEWLPLPSDGKEKKEYITTDQFIESRKKLAEALKTKKKNGANAKNNAHRR